MHLWPSMRLRDSFKIGYLKKLELNLNRMNAEKQQEDKGLGNQQKLLDKNGSGDAENFGRLGFGSICREIFMVLSCCYCCFCCGACTDDDESS